MMQKVLHPVPASISHSCAVHGQDGTLLHLCGSTAPKHFIFVLPCAFLAGPSRHPRLPLKRMAISSALLLRRTLRQLGQLLYWCISGDKAVLVSGTDTLLRETNDTGGTALPKPEDWILHKQVYFLLSAVEWSRLRNRGARLGGGCPTRLPLGSLNLLSEL